MLKFIVRVKKPNGKWSVIAGFKTLEDARNYKSEYENQSAGEYAIFKGGKIWETVTVN